MNGVNFVGLMKTGKNMKFESTIVGKEFIEHRDKLASDLKGENTTFRADFEWPEWWMGYYIPEITGHKLCHHYSYDTTHPEWGKCEFKYLPKNGFIKIGLYTQRQQFDQFIFWNWKKPVHILEEGTILDFEITDVIDREFVLKAMKEDQSYDRFNYNKHVLLNESVV